MKRQKIFLIYTITIISDKFESVKGYEIYYKIYRANSIISYKKNNVVINLTEDEAELIREWVLDELQMKGFGRNDELTNEGEILEDFIDLFYTR